MTPQTAVAGATPPAPGPPSGLRGRPWPTLLTVATGVMMVALDGTIVFIANPVIQKGLGASLSDVQWITNAYLLALAVALITAGKLGDRFGHRLVFLIGITGFAASSGLIALSHSVSTVIALRALQGLSGAMLMPAALGLLRATFPAEKLNMAIGLWGGVIGGSAAGGPILGGLLVEHVNWQSVFFVNVPVGAVALALGLIVLKDHRAENAPRSFDLLGIALLSGAMFCLVWALIKVPSWHWGSARTLLFLGASLLAFVTFALWQTRSREPLLPLRLFRSVPFSAGAALMILMAFSFMGGLFYVTFYLQNVHGMSPVAAGLRLLPLTGMMIFASPAAGALITRVGPRLPLFGGMVLTAGACFGMSTLEVDSGTPLMSVLFALFGTGLAPVVVGATEVIVSNAPVEHAGLAGGLQQGAMQVGGTLGTAVLGAVMASRVGHVLPGRWTDAGLPPLTGEQRGAVSSAVEIGVAPVPEGTPPEYAARITDVAHGTFVSAMSTSFVVAGCVAVVAAVLALFTRAGDHDAGRGAAPL
ncbi:MFS transporter [Streptomyces caatingaensis]|uniref:Tetracenomycin C resistance and export protein n=1 Tax=Streptomyces caatingaensis TaxID=1678637 RepID=A0A0K9XHR7_9ACTN|nr:MFS transporter [Streptomyces caatingaensis]KNB52944.1 tetracenomycin C resistance and export protein [Streptomyces caatingaensis]